VASGDQRACCSLCYTRSGNPATAKSGWFLYPWLAESWDIASDKLSITFYLREDVQFFDGTLLTPMPSNLISMRKLKLYDNLSGNRSTCWMIIQSG
jgi:hypothetical protein